VVLQRLEIKVDEALSILDNHTSTIQSRYEWLMGAVIVATLALIVMALLF